MKDHKGRNIDLEDTVELPVIKEQDQQIDNQDPFRIIFPFVSKIGIFLALILSFTLAARAIYIYFYGESISLIDDTRLTFTGINGSGYADDSFHPENNAISKLKQIKSSQDIDALIESIDCSFDYSSSLSNGMNITYACTYNVQAAKEANINIRNASRSYTVMGLIDKEILDPFDNIKIDWDSEDASVHIDPDQKYIDLGISYKTEDNHDGTMSITVSYDAGALQKQGYFIPAEDRSKTINIPQKISIEEVSDEHIEKIKETLLSKAESELYACSFQISFGKQTLSTFHPSFDSFRKNDDGTYDAIISLSNVYSLSSLADYYHFTIQYSGYFLKDENGDISFHTNDAHGCTYDGFGSDYSIKKEDLSSS